MDLIYVRSRKRQDLLSKLGSWGSWERVDTEGSGQKYIQLNNSIKTILKRENVQQRSSQAYLMGVILQLRVPLPGWFWFLSSRCKLSSIPSPISGTNLLIPINGLLDISWLQGFCSGFCCFVCFCFVFLCICVHLCKGRFVHNFLFCICFLSWSHFGIKIMLALSKSLIEFLPFLFT